MSIICSQTCATGTITQQDWNALCNDIPRTGGVSRFVFVKADFDISTLPYADGLDNVENIKYLICNNALVYSGKLMGNVPDPSDTSIKVDSCSPEVSKSRTLTIEARDMINYDTTDANFGAEYDFWNAIKQNRKCLLFGYLTCDDRLYTSDKSFSIRTREIIEDSTDGSSYFQHTVTIITTPELLKPHNTAGLNEWLDEHSPIDACYYGI